jgi:hypothetical protein
VPATAFAMHGLLGEHEWWQQVHGEHRAQISQAYILGNAFANPQVLEDGLLPLDAGNLPPFLQHLADRRVLTVRRRHLPAGHRRLLVLRPSAAVDRTLAVAAERRRRPARRAVQRLRHNPPPQLHIDNLSAIVVRLHAILTKQHYPPHQSRRIFEGAQTRHKNGLQSLPNRVKTA